MNGLKAVLSLGSSSSKEAIIQILAERQPLTAKEIHNSMKREGKNGHTYQATHKAIKEMVGQEVLVEAGKKYSISDKWVEGLSEFGKSIKNTQTENHEAVLECLYDVDKYLLKFVEDHPPEEGEKPFLGLHWCHFWVPLFLTEHVYSTVKEMGPYFDIYSLSRGSTYIDKWCEKFWKKDKWNIKTGAHLTNSSDLLIYKGHVVYVHYPKEILKLLDGYYNKTKSMEDFDPDYLLKNVLLKKIKIPVTITKDAALARQMEMETRELFRGAKK